MIKNPKYTTKCLADKAIIETILALQKNADFLVNILPAGKLKNQIADIASKIWLLAEPIDIYLRGQVNELTTEDRKEVKTQKGVTKNG